MKTINIVGAGGIGRAAALLALHRMPEKVTVYIGDRNEEALRDCAIFCEQHERLRTYELDMDDPPKEIFADSDVILDCLPGSLAPQVARLALEHECHYANLTEYVHETAEIRKMANGAKTGFILQTGLAPGYINVLAMDILNRFKARHKVNHVEDVQMKVGALTKSAIAPHYYGFTWSPVGVATEYVKDAIILRDHKVVRVTALSEIQKLTIGGGMYEASYTSGGAADLPEALKGQVNNLDYRTLRYPGHYDWVKNILESAPVGEDKIAYLQKTMLDVIPIYDDDIVVLYVHVTGYDNNAVLRRMERTVKVEPKDVAGRRLTAIQATTAAPLLESAQILLKGSYQGVVLQSMIEPSDFLYGEVVSFVYDQEGP